MFEDVQIKLSQLTRMSTFTFYVSTLRSVEHVYYRTSRHYASSRLTRHANKRTLQAVQLRVLGL